MTKLYEASLHTEKLNACSLSDPGYGDLSLNNEQINACREVSALLSEETKHPNTGAYPLERTTSLDLHDRYRGWFTGTNREQ